MLTDKPTKSATRPTAASAASIPAAVAAPTAAAKPEPVDVESLTCYFQGGFVPMRDARISIMTHAFMYGTRSSRGSGRTGTPSRASSTGCSCASTSSGSGTPAGSC